MLLMLFSGVGAGSCWVLLMLFSGVGAGVVVVAGIGVGVVRGC